MRCSADSRAARMGWLMETSIETTLLLNGSYDRPLAGLLQAIQETQREGSVAAPRGIGCESREDDATVETLHRFPSSQSFRICRF